MISIVDEGLCNFKKREFLMMCKKKKKKKKAKLSDKVYSSQTMNCLKTGLTTPAPPASPRKPFGEARSWKYFQKNC